MLLFFRKLPQEAAASVTKAIEEQARPVSGSQGTCPA